MTLGRDDCEHEYEYRRPRAQGEPPSAWYCKHCGKPEEGPYRPPPEETEVREILQDIYTPEGVDVWMRAAHRALGGGSPEAAIRTGDGAKVLDMARRLAQAPARAARRTWRTVLAEAQADYIAADERRRRLIAEGITAGLTYRQAAEAMGLGGPTVHKLAKPYAPKPAQRTTLDSEAEIPR
jgi:hypothetical protein